MGKQTNIVFDLVKELQPVRTEIIKIEALRRGISCGDRYLRWLQNENKVESERKKGDKTHTWTLCKPETTECFPPIYTVGYVEEQKKDKPLSTIQASQLNLMLN